MTKNALIKNIFLKQDVAQTEKHCVTLFKFLNFTHNYFTLMFKLLKDKPPHDFQFGVNFGNYIISLYRDIYLWGYFS